MTTTTELTIRPVSPAAAGSGRLGRTARDCRVPGWSRRPILRRGSQRPHASFGAYAEVVRSPAYRDDKRGTTLQVLPELLSGHRGATLTVRAGAVTVTGPQAVLVSNNAYEMGDIAGLGHRARLDAGTLGIVVITVNSAMGAVGLLGGGGVMVLTADEVVVVVVDADEPEIPVGIDARRS
jgi:hypothetical protein